MASPGQHLKQFFSQKQQICGLVAFPPSGGGLTNTITVLNQKGRITFHSFPCLQLSEAKRLHRQNYAVVCLRRKKKRLHKDDISLCVCLSVCLYLDARWQVRVAQSDEIRVAQSERPKCEECVISGYCLKWCVWCCPKWCWYPWDLPRHFHLLRIDIGEPRATQKWQDSKACRWVAMGIAWKPKWERRTISYIICTWKKWCSMPVYPCKSNKKTFPQLELKPFPKRLDRLCG